MLMTAPKTYPTVVKEVIHELGIDPDRYGEFHHEDLFITLEISRGIFFDKASFGADHLSIASA
jgi:hypothetical protein